MADALSGLKFLRALPYVDAGDVAAVGHSFEGSLTVLLAEREPNLARGRGANPSCTGKVRSPPRSSSRMSLIVSGTGHLKIGQQALDEWLRLGNGTY